LVRKEKGGKLPKSVSGGVLVNSLSEGRQRRFTVPLGNGHPGIQRGKPGGV